MPESAIKFGAYESAKRAFARFEGHNDPRRLQPTSQFLSGGFGGMVAQYVTLSPRKTVLSNSDVDASSTLLIPSNSECNVTPSRVA
jgi:hypothetical protein